MKLKSQLKKNKQKIKMRLAAFLIQPDRNLHHKKYEVDKSYQKFHQCL